jgi:hypothetical protein
MTGRASRIVFAATVLACFVAAFAPAQTTTETKRFEVIAVDGNQIVVKLPEGTRELTVPEDFRFTVDGQPMSVHELKPGMTGTATITTTTTMKPVTVTEVKNGTVFDVTGSSIIVQTDEGFKSFTEGQLDKRGIRIMREGQPAELSDFHKGDKLTAVIVTTKPPQMVTERSVAVSTSGEGKPTPTGASGAAPGSAAPTAPGGAAPAAAAPGRAASGEAGPAKLPKTAGPLPLMTLVGVGSTLAALGIRIRRRR